MAGRCSLCGHPERSAIELAALSVVPSSEAELDLCERHGISKVALRRHMTHAAPAARALQDDSRVSASGRPVQVTPFPATEPPEDAAASIKAMLAAGEPLNRVYEAAARLATGFLSLGLGPDQGRAWTTLRQLLRQAASAEEATIDRHPSFAALVEDLVAAVVDELGPDAPEGLEGRIADRFEQLQAARLDAAPKRRVAA